MPQIKFTAVIADMRGKSNGSVFSKNRAGNYFRNQTSGGGRKSPRWNNQKTKIASTVQQWRSLTSDQQRAWNEAAPSFPATNKVGDPREQSGFELFTKVNARRATLKKPVQMLPPAPTVLPNPGTPELANPEQFQFTPEMVLNSLPTVPTASPRHLVGDVSDLGYNVNSGLSFTMALKFNRSSVFAMAENDPQKIIVINFSDSSALTAELIRFSGDLFQIRISTNLTPGSFFVGISNPALTSGEWTSVQLSFKPEIGENGFFKIGFTGEYTPVLVDSTLVDETGINSVELHPYTTGNLQLFEASDFRMYNFVLNEAQLNLSARGYVLGQEIVMYPMDAVINGVLPDALTEGTGHALTFTGGDLSATNLLNDGRQLPPYFVIENLNPGAANAALNIYASPALSNGRIGAFSKVRMLGSFDYQTDDNIPIADQYRSTFAFVPEGGLVRVWLETIDIDSGLPLNPPQEIANKGPKFKAGSELAGSVNTSR